MYRVGVLHSHPLIAWAVDRALAAVPEIEVGVLNGHPGRKFDHFAAVGVLDVLITDHAGDRPPSASYVLLMSPHTETPEIPGVDGHLCEYSTPGEIVKAVQQAVVGGPSAADGGPVPVGAAELSRREQQVLTFIADGLTHAQTARSLGISRHTVDTHVKRIKGKLGVGTKAELTRAAAGLCWV
jgi:DNA-binding CsgD family transcriptional regulator